MLFVELLKNNDNNSFFIKKMVGVAVTDEQYLSALKTVFDLLPALFTSDVSITLIDLEKYVRVIQAKSFESPYKEGEHIIKPLEVIIKERKSETVRVKDSSGMPLLSRVMAVVNPDTGNVVGTLSCAMPQEKEQQVIDVSGELKSFTGELSLAADELAKVAASLAAGGQKMTKDVEAAHEHISKTDDILQYIKNVAETTNLLGLNAAIEAARAGEHGRGFSVVAGEIRKLAQNSKTSAAEIAGTLSRVRDDINRILGFMNEFAAVSEELSVQTRQISAGNSKLRELGGKLNKLSENLFQ